MGWGNSRWAAMYSTYAFQRYCYVVMRYACMHVEVLVESRLSSDMHIEPKVERGRERHEHELSDPLSLCTGLTSIKELILWVVIFPPRFTSPCQTDVFRSAIETLLAWKSLTPPWYLSTFRLSMFK